MERVPETLAIGGLMRCCTGTWNAVMIQEALRAWQDGDTVQCDVAKDDSTHRMIRTGGVWRWVGPPPKKKEA
jgi:hypothetical protein